MASSFRPMSGLFSASKRRETALRLFMRGAGFVPLFLLQPALGRIVRHVARAQPDLFERLGPHTNTNFLIDPLDMNFVLILKPDPYRPLLKALRKEEKPPHGARIAGDFFTLFALIDGQLDGDSLFFTRALTVEGDTEAIVCLRNALDDLDTPVTEEIATAYGPLGRRVLSLLRRLRKIKEEPLS